MTDDSSCIFCEIVAGRAPATIIAENERAIAFMDINPVTPGHALVIPRAHAVDVFDVDADDLTACSRLAQLVAGRALERLEADGVNLLNCSREAAWQTVFHFHLHVIPRYADSGRDGLQPPWPHVAGDPQEIARYGRLLADP